MEYSAQLDQGHYDLLRGSNENANRLIRRWIPKGTKTATPEEVAAIENWINHYPEKMFDFKCSLELAEGVMHLTKTFHLEYMVEFHFG